MKPVPDAATDPMRLAAIEVVRRIQTAGFEAFWVGGCVRDFLLGHVPSDYDVATAATPDQIEQIFPKTLPVGRRFGVVVVVQNGFSIQVATFRAEAGYQDGRHPDKVTFSNARADALRRDFTVNGLFHNPVTGETHDWVDGRKDLEAKTIRTIGDPEERFGEDHLRMLRALRFAAQLGFQVEHRTINSIRSRAERIQSVSAERIRDELLKLFHPRHAERGLRLLEASGLLRHVLPEFAPCLASPQHPAFHPEGSVFEHVCLMLAHVPADAHPLLPWAVLLHDIGKPETFSRDPITGVIHNYGHEKTGAQIAEKLLSRLRFPRKEISLLVRSVKSHMQFKDASRMRKSTLRRMLLRPTFDFELALHQLDCLGSHHELDTYDFLLREAAELSKRPEVRPPLVNGDDLISLGFKPGPALGRVLNEIRERQLQDELKTREDAIAFSRAHLVASA